ncbi:protein MEI2-like 5 [Apium graveolens]|uniref:protein MEI2-like 5 n=1 Tax=Apium graveolens TaxID=4045 RepID=UPI003D7BB94E
MQQSSGNSIGPLKIRSIKVSNKEGGPGAHGFLSGSDDHNALSDTALFSSSLPVFPHGKLKLNCAEDGFQTVDDLSSTLNKVSIEGDAEFLGNVEDHAIGNLLPDDEDELLAGITDGYDCSCFPNQLEDSEEYDLFGSGGGLELESDAPDNVSPGVSRIGLAESLGGNGVAQYNLSNGAGVVAGEHPYGEHPSRTLFVRNINSNVEDSELRTMFEQYGDIRNLYTACKHRGFVMISYYDIRAARTAMRALQNKPLRGRKLDIHFSIPKDNPSDKDMNQGTLVVFNLDPSVSNDDLLHIFGAYGEVKEIRETPHKRHHKFVEYYDVRSSEAALRSLNRSDIAGKRIKLEPSRPGGARRNLMLQLGQDLEQDGSRSFLLQVGSSITNSPPGNWSLYDNPVGHTSLQSLSRSPVLGSMNPAVGNSLPGLASILHPHLSNPRKIAPIGKDLGRGSPGDHTYMNGNLNQGVDFQQSHSLPEPNVNQFSATSALGASNGSGIETLSGPQFLWGSPNVNAEQSNLSMRRPPQVKQPFISNGQYPGFTYAGNHDSIIGSSQSPHQHHLHHVGSAPSNIPFKRQFSHYQEPSDALYMSRPAFGGMGLNHNDKNFMGPRTSGNTFMPENGSPSFSMVPSARPNPMFLGNGHYPGVSPVDMEVSNERGKSRRFEQNASQIDNRKQFQLDLEKILNGEDTRTTLMIKNIPNKYTSKMLLAAIDDSHSCTYDFFYLPIDFKNKCNVGYAFINMLSPAHIVPFYQAFNGKKWEKFNSEKVAFLAYARIQGKAALAAHFQNSSLMNEDKRCRPILFHSDGSEVGDQVTEESRPSSSLSFQIARSKLSGSDPRESLGSAAKDGAGERNSSVEK